MVGRLYHHASGKRISRKLSYKETWILDALTSLNLVQDSPKDVLDRFFAEDGRIYVSKWRKNRIKFAVLNRVFTNLLEFIGEPGKGLLNRIYNWCYVYDQIKRYRAHLRELRMFVNPDFLDKRGQTPTFSDRGKDLFLNLVNTKNIRKLGKHKALWRFYRTNYNTVAMFNKYGFHVHPLYRVIIESAKRAQENVGKMVLNPELYQDNIDVTDHSNWNSVFDGFLNIAAFPAGTRTLPARLQARLRGARVRRQQKLVAALLYNWKTTVFMEVGLATDVKFIAEVGLNGLNMGPLIHVKSEIASKRKFIKPSSYGRVAVIDV